MLTWQTIKKCATKLRIFILDIIYPIECISCGKEGAWICSQCFANMPIKQKQKCPECKKINFSGKLCQRCSKQYFFDGAMIACDYTNKTVAKAIKNFKYKLIIDLKIPISQLLNNFLKKTIDKALIGDAKSFNYFFKDKIMSDIIIIPVPLHKKRFIWRGFNQAEELAKIINNKFESNLNINDLLRIKNTKPQTKLSKIQRQKNLKNSFIWQGKSLENKKILLIDDVLTTGTTLNECAKILKQHGAKQVWALVFAQN